MFTKSLSVLAALCCIPIFFSSIIIGLIGLDHLTNGGMYVQLLSGTLNNKFIAWMFCLTALATSPIVTFCILCVNRSSKIDDLDKAIREAYEEKEKYETARNKYADALIKNDNQPK